MASAKIIVGGAAALGLFLAFVLGGTSRAAGKKKPKGDDGGGGGPPNPPDTGGPKLGCSPTEAQDMVLGTAASPEDISRKITGVPNGDAEFMAANQPASGSGWRYVYRIDTAEGDPADAGPPNPSAPHKTTRRTYNAYVDPKKLWAEIQMSLDTDPGPRWRVVNVAWESLTIAAGTTVHLPVSWNKYMRWDGQQYDSPGDGSTFPPCEG